MYQVLARKYRPRNFSQLVGQTHVSRALTSALERGRLHHAYLFTGTRGVGKTTIARILAKCLNCETGVTAMPCETCDICRAVNEGRFIDLIEIDAASRTRVEDTRELLDNVPYAPTQGRYKVYLIDEVHMLSTHSFNALLKTLEEPPEHVKFLFATTDPQKLPITVISRCLQFTLRPLGKDEIFQHLEQILGQEQIQHEAEALWQLAESAQGSMRDALSLTDQAIAYGQGQVIAQDVQNMLGLIDKNLVFDLLLAIHKNQRSQVAQLVQQMRQQAIDVLHVLEQVISTLHEAAILQCLGQLSTENLAQEEQRKQQLAQTIAAQDMQLYYQIALQGRADLSLALTPEQGFEMCIMRLLAFRPMAVGEVLSVASDYPSVLTPKEHIESATIASNSQTEPQVSNENFSTEHDNLKVDEQHNHVQNVLKPLTIAPETSMHHEQEQSQDIKQQKTASLDTNKSIQDCQPSAWAPDFDQQSELSAQQISVQDQPLLAETFSTTQAIKVRPEINASATENVIHQSLQDQTIDIVESYDIAQVEEQSEPQIDLLDTVQQPSQSLQEIELKHEQNHIKQDDIEDPRALLLAKEQQLTGEWNLEKWDYWLRQSDLTPAIKEFAQHGMMYGQISGKSELHLDPSYQGMFEQFEHVLQTHLQQLSADLQLQVRYHVMTEQCPYTLQQQRKRDAYQAAYDKVAEHAAVSALSEHFSASIENLKLKS
ncbi:DNA polymerase III subunit gamma/tau [Acinetobacter qingfengensis]|uniref:DNA polymerase III subunit gamma/tau n=1 Tax=Acinetobacter qingfengensis TaxID=1262585 RepID=A0A1E7RDK2_9GAMM|nr:DNA polymerase III subunit gamma/tau [Acinetobacter qingfengensis]KAA8735326.1 DNA polymerase III subunit gamma/tau [Acinetobacter qingfengensis]OEY97444.1 DNA polymerase III, subunit gamma and tau [Acinetobacter qingfengensis]